MIKRAAMGVALAAAMIGGVALSVTSASANGGESTGWVEHPSSTINCLRRPQNTVCIKFDDGYVLVAVGDAITGWDTFTGHGATVQIARGVGSDYYHKLGTNWVMKVGH